MDFINPPDLSSTFLEEFIISQLLWTPTPERVQRAALTHFRRASEVHTGRVLPDYQVLHTWSVADPAAFWKFYAEYAGIRFSTPPTRIMSNDPMPYVRWFEGATLNYARELLYPPGLKDETIEAVVAFTEAGETQRLSYAELRRAVARCAAALKRSGVGVGDRVAASLSNTPEALILLLASASVGAVFSSCSPDFGADAAADRFGQIQPKLLVASGGYRYNGKAFRTLETVEKLHARLGEPETVVVPFDREAMGVFQSWEEWLGDEAADLTFQDHPFDHPLYILYSSGTTGLPKAIVHRAGGALLAHHREHRLHCDIKPGDRVFYFTTCGWMMWNWLVSTLAQGATLILYDGSPSYPDLGALWRLVNNLNVTHFGTSARFLHGCETVGVVPKTLAPLAALRCLLSTGSPLSPSGFSWVYESVKEDLHLASIAGGTDIVSCFVGGDPTAPVYAGQLQAPGLGVDLAVYNEAGESVVGEAGELVCRTPLPSMPLAFWNDPEYTRYGDAYLNVYPGVWRHGDLAEMTREEGVVIYGRSDAILNPGGVRIGTAELYRPLETLSSVHEALAVGKKEDGDEVIWLFVVLRAEETLNKALTEEIRTAIRRASSPRHVPKRIFQVQDLPRTRSGKLMEVAVARLVNAQEVPNRQVMENPDALDALAEVVKLS